MNANSSEAPTLALLLPSKGRLFDLFLTLALTPLPNEGPVIPKFFVCANYPAWQLAFLKTVFSSRADFIDERTLAFKGMVGAYNHAFSRAQEVGARWVALWADDLLPDRSDWLGALVPILQREDFCLGIFSSDEGNHQRRYGFNIFAGYPCAHFFVARTSALPGYLLNPAFRSYTGDNEIAVSFVKRGLPVDFLPIRVMHQPTSNTTRKSNASSYKQDLDVFYGLHPELTGKLDAIVLTGDVVNDHSRFVADKGEVLQFRAGMDNMWPYEEFVNCCPVQPQSVYLRSIWFFRRMWNQWIVLSVRQLLLSFSGRSRSL